jgi:hypothetical protein
MVECNKHRILNGAIMQLITFLCINDCLTSSIRVLANANCGGCQTVNRMRNFENEK